LVGALSGELQFQLLELPSVILFYLRCPHADTVSAAADAGELPGTAEHHRVYRPAGGVHNLRVCVRGADGHVDTHSHAHPSAGSHGYTSAAHPDAHPSAAHTHADVRSSGIDPAQRPAGGLVQQPAANHLALVLDRGPKL
jgi:hypothetical protein